MGTISINQENVGEGTWSPGSSEAVQPEVEFSPEEVIVVDPQIALKKLEAEKLKALRKALDEINKSKTIKGQTNFYPEFQFEPLKRIKLPFIQVNHALGGGIPLGRVIEIYGFESSGKSLFCARTVAEFQKAGLRCCWMDMERCLDPKFYADFGVNLDDLIIGTPETAEDCFNTMDILINSGAVDLIIVDSVAAMITKEQKAKTAEEKTMASLARIMSGEIPKLLDPCDENNCTIIFINQVRDNVGVMYGDSEVTPGGRALRFYASIRMELKRKSASVVLDSNGKDPVGHGVNIRVIKNKTAPPGRKGEFMIYYDGREITLKDTLEEAFDVAVNTGLISRPTVQTYLYESGGFSVSGSRNKFIEKLLEDELMRNLFVGELTAA
mgnify:CR=1 FL=1